MQCDVKVGEEYLFWRLTVEQMGAINISKYLHGYIDSVWLHISNQTETPSDFTCLISSWSLNDW